MKAMAYRMMMMLVELVFGVVVGQAIIRRITMLIHLVTHFP